MTYRTHRGGARAAARLAVVALLAAAGCIVVNVPPAGAGLRRAASTATSPDCGPRVRKNLVSSWRCTFSDDFSGSALDATKWQPITTADNGQTAGGACFLASPNNVSVHDGALYLTVRKEAAPFTCASPKGAFVTQYSGGQVATYGRFAQTYGRFAVRAKFPATTLAGLQSALWMWPQNPAATGAVGEIDIAEWYGNHADRAIPYLHYLYDPATTDVANHVNVPTNPNCLIADAGAFHEYVAEWTSTSIRIRYDGQTCLLDYYRPLGPNPFAQPFFVALSAALGIGDNAFDPARTPLPATTEIDWVRAWK